MRSIEELVNRFRKNGLRVTPQRRLIFEALEGDDSHPSVNEVYQRVKYQMPEISLATVYNTLHELVDLGELRLVEDLRGSSTRYDTETNHHHHLYCERCHRLIDMIEDIQPLSIPQENVQRFIIQRSQVTFYGICPECQGRTA